MRSAKVRKLFVAGLVIPLVALSGAVGASAAVRQATKHLSFGGQITVTYSTTSSAEDFPLNLAIDTGIMKKYGLDNVNFEVVGAAALDPALESGAIQLTFGSSPGLELAYQEGVPVKLIAATCTRDVSYLVARPEIPNVAALAGKSVGSSSATSVSQIMMLYALHSAGVKPNQVTYVPTTSADAVGELLAGEVSANVFNVEELHQAQAENPGIHVIYTYLNQMSPWPSGNIWGFTPWMASHKAETVAFLRAMNTAVVKWNSDKTVAYEELAKWGLTTSPTTIAQTYITTQQELNHGSQPVHLPSTHIEAYVNKVLREIGFSTAYNSYAEEGQEWTPTYWDAAFKS